MKCVGISCSYQFDECKDCKCEYNDSCDRIIIVNFDSPGTTCVVNNIIRDKQSIVVIDNNGKNDQIEKKVNDNFANKISYVIPSGIMTKRVIVSWRNKGEPAFDCQIFVPKEHGVKV